MKIEIRTRIGARNSNLAFVKKTRSENVIFHSPVLQDAVFSLVFEAFAVMLNTKRRVKMLKRLMKLALAATLVAGLATPAMADTELTGQGVAYFGQLTNTKKVAARDSAGAPAEAAEAPSGFVHAFDAEMHADWTSDNGKLNAKVGIIKRTFEKDTLPLRPNVTWTINNTFKMEIGQITPVEMNLFTSHGMDASFTTCGTLGASFYGLAARYDDPGIGFWYTLNPYSAFHFALYTNDALYSTTYSSKMIPLYSAALPAIEGSEYDQQGNAMSMGYAGAPLDSIYIGAGYGTSTADKNDGGPTYTTTAMIFSLKYSMGAMVFDIGFNSVNREWGTGFEVLGFAIDSTRKDSEMGLGFVMKKAGPGTFKFVYGTMNTDIVIFPDAPAAIGMTSETKTTITDLDFTYDIPIDDDAGFEIKLLQKNTSTDVVIGTSSVDDIAVTFYGVGLYAMF